MSGKLSLPLTIACIFHLIFIFSYLTTSNVDYRLAFLGIGTILDLKYFISKSLYSRVVLLLMFFSLYFVYQVGYSEVFPGIPTQVIGDLTLHLVVTYLGARSIFLLKQLKSEDHLS